MWTKLQWHNTFWNEILLSELMLINNAFAGSVIYKAVRFRPRAFLPENMRILVNEKKRKNPLFISCDNIEYKSKYVVKIFNSHFYEYTFFYKCKQSKHIICMKTKINIIFDLSSVDKIDTRQFLFNRTIVVGSFSMCYWSTFLKVIMFRGLAIKGQLNIL